MTSVTRTFLVHPPPSVVVPYLADFTHAVDWDPGTQTCTRIDDGPVTVGASWHNTSKLAGISTELTYTLEALTEDRVVLVGRNDTATSTETIDVRPADEGSQISYTNETVFNGAAKLVDPLAQLVFQKVGQDTEEQITRCVNALTAQLDA